MDLPEPEAVLKMVAGPEMDELIHQLALNLPKRGKTPKYSSDLSKACELVMHFPVYVGRMRNDHLSYSEQRPFLAGIDGVLIVTADTPAKALCKAILMYLREKPVAVERASDHPDETAATGEG